MSDITKHNANLPGGMIPDDFAERLLTGVAETRAGMATAGGGAPLLRMGKDGIWVFGQSNDEVQAGSEWLVNPMLFAHGWVCWIQETSQKNRKGGEIMCSMAEPLPPEPAPVEGRFPYQKQYAAVLKCMNGNDAGTEVLFKTPSMGGTEAVGNLIDAFRRHFVTDRAHPCPVVILRSTNYQHPNYGKIYKPVLEVIDWADMNGNFADQEAQNLEPPPQRAAATQRQPAPPWEQPEAPPPPPPRPAPAAAAEPTRPRKPPLEIVEPRPEPVPTAQTHTGQRRRPTAR